MTGEYKAINAGVILRVADNVYLPVPPPGATEPPHPSYAKYLADIAAGATLLPADPPPIVYSGSIDVDQRLRTSDALGQTREIYRATLAQVTLYRARLELLGVDAGNGNARYIQAAVVAKRVGAGAVMVGSPAVVVNLQDAGASTWAITATVSGNDFVVTCSGQAGRVIDWRLSGAVVSFTPGGS